jgi:hypothetical protein
VDCTDQPIPETAEKLSKTHPVALAVTQHDPDGLLVPQFTRVLPTLQRIFSDFCVAASAAASPQALEKWRAAGAHIVQNTPAEDRGEPKIGRSRRRAVTLALETQAEAVIYLDADRAFHWAEFYPTELAFVTRQVIAWDFCVLGRSRRAFNTHPRFQTETEKIINHIFGMVYGQTWDVTAGARGISRQAAEEIRSFTADDGLSTDISWTLRLGQMDYTLGYLETEGLEYETADRYAAQVAAAGGLEAWVKTLEDDPRRWVARLALALEEARAVLPFAPPPDAGPSGPFSQIRD